MTITIPPRPEPNGAVSFGDPAGLAERIEHEHRLAEDHARDALEHAFRCGELLIEAKRLVGHGGFLPWLAENIAGFGARQAQKYMRAAQNRELLAANANSGSHLTTALRALAEPREGTHGTWTGEQEWYTPAAYVEAAREVLGAIDLDPATSGHAQRTVQAATHYTAETDGLAQPWQGRVWLNPPYQSDLVAAFVVKLLAEHASGDVSEAVLLVHGRTDAAWFHDAARGAAAVCLTRGRISFERSDGPGDSPTTGSAFFYFGARPDRFAATFGAFGVVFPAAMCLH
jgi:phage N-6-adenine-methyltransferase